MRASRRVHILFLASVLVTALCRPAGAAAGTLAVPQLSTPAAIVIDGWTGNVLFARRPDAEHEPASTVKIMTALVVLRRHIPLRRVITVSPLAVGYGGSTADLFVGERLTVRDLLYGMLLPSGNDAAAALAEGTGGTVQRFVGWMNREAHRLRLRHTFYQTPNGFDRFGQVTTPRDLSRLARVAMGLRAFARVVRTRTHVVRDSDGRIVHVWTNVNHLLWTFPAVDGVKTGTTPGAGACLVSSIHADGKWVIEVNMDSTPDARYSDGAALLNYGMLVDGDAPQAS